MRNGHRSPPALTVAAGFAVLFAGSPPMVGAQDQDIDQAAAADDADEVIEVVEESDQVRVTGARVATEGLLVGQGDRIELTYWVSYADLDVGQEGGARELEQRIGAAAEHICNVLADMYPAGAPEPDVCAHEAFDQAMTRFGDTG